MVTVLRPLSTSELLDRTFHLYRNNFLVFVGIVAIPQLFVLLLHLGSAAMIVGRQFIGMGIGLLITAIANLIAIEIAHAATVVAVSDLHLDRPASIGGAYSTARPSMGRVIGISFGIGIAVGIGFLFLAIPGIYLALAWSLAIPVTVLEGGGLSASTNRSSDLTKGSKWRILAIYVLIVVLTIIVSLLIEMPLNLIAGVMAKGEGAGGVALGQALQAIGNFISTSLVGPLVTIALTLIYYDQRVRKEGFDLQLMMSALQPNATPPSAASGAAGA